MNERLQRWVTLPLAGRITSLAGMSLLLLALAWLTLLHPQQQARELQARQQEAIAQQIVQRQQQLAARPTIEALEREIAHLQQPAIETEQRQTLENLITSRGTQLESWLPGNQPQQLQLRLNWPQFLPLFGEMALARVSVPLRFELRAEQEALSTVLWLESDDAE